LALTIARKLLPGSHVGDPKNSGAKDTHSASLHDMGTPRRAVLMSALGGLT